MSSPGLPTPVQTGACDNDRGTTAIIVEGVLVSLALVVVIFWLFSRMHARKGLTLNDFAMFFGMFVGLMIFAIAVPAKLYGIGKHASCLNKQDRINGLRLLFVSQLLVYVAVFFVKLSITLFHLRLGGLGRPSRIALIVNIVFLAFAKAAFMIELLVQCRPIAGYWDPTIEAHCVSPSVTVGLSYASAVIAVITDFCCIFLPLPMLWDLKMKRRTKVSIIALMLMGTFAMACGIMRATKVNNLYDTEDITWAILPISLWTIAELYVGIITGSLPPCRALFVSLIAKVRNRPSPAGGYMFAKPENRLHGRSYMLQSLSLVDKLLTRNRNGQPTNTVRFTDRSRDSTGPWVEPQKMESQIIEGIPKSKVSTETIVIELSGKKRGSFDW